MAQASIVTDRLTMWPEGYDDRCPRTAVAFPGIASAWFSVVRGTGMAFHVGVLWALQHDLDWDARSADVIVETSAGSIVGALLRAGVAPEDACSPTVWPIRPHGSPLSSVCSINGRRSRFGSPS